MAYQSWETADHEIEYYGREGRRMNGRYQMVHCVRVDGALFEVQAPTKEKAVEIAIKKSLPQ